MNIKEASLKTGLTKRAIKYYEEFGIVEPKKNDVNSYREYSDEDIVKLNLVRALRILDIPLSDIKDVIANEKNLKDIMKSSFSMIEKSIEELQKSKLVLGSLLDKDLDNYSSIGDEIIKLRKSLELSMDERRIMVSELILEKFPGKFGELFVAMNEPFLNINIDSEVKKDAWLRIVELLDDIEAVDKNNYFMQWYEKAELGDMDEYKAKLRAMRQERVIGCITEDEIKKRTARFLNSVKEDSGYSAMYPEIKKLTAEKEKTFGDVQRKFNECLKVLSEDYRKYLENMVKLSKGMNEECIKQTGLDIENYFKKCYEKKSKQIYNL